MLKENDDLSWYGRKAAGLSLKNSPSAGAAQYPNPEKLDHLIKELKKSGIKGDFKTRTLFTRGLPPGCKGCLKGRGTNLYVTGLCTRDCFFCFNNKPRRDEIVVHGIPVKNPEDVSSIVERYDLRSVGISGGEPLLYPKRVIAIIQALRRMPRKTRIDLYTNGDRADKNLLLKLRDAGLDSLRFNLVARDYDPSPIPEALRIFNDVTVEVPVIPGQIEKLKSLALNLDSMGVPYMVIHELFICSENNARVAKENLREKPQKVSRHLLWKPTRESEEAALEFLLFALNSLERMGVYYCSCGTQETISRRGLMRRRKSAGMIPVS
ncbi:MAG: radical SAM protein [Elusimicrobiota bacterium]